MSFIEIIQNNFYAVVAFGVLVVGSLIFNVMRMRKLKSGSQNFLSQHPEAAKIYLSSRAAITSELVEVYSVNDQAPVQFTDGNQLGFYLLPGRSTVEISYSHNRPGVLHKNVTTSTGVVQKQLEVEAYKAYQLGFDRKQEVFTFTEC